MKNIFKNKLKYYTNKKIYYKYIYIEGRGDPWTKSRAAPNEVSKAMWFNNEAA